VSIATNASTGRKGASTWARPRDATKKKGGSIAIRQGNKTDAHTSKGSCLRALNVWGKKRSPYEKKEDGMIKKKNRLSGKGG